jgi:hypothetical protein
LYNKNQKNHIIKEMKEEIKKGEMPLFSYTLIHKNTTLTKQQSTLFLNWLETINKY